MDSQNYKRISEMNVTEIRHQSISAFETKAFKNAETIKKAELSASEQPTTTIKDTAWRQNIILDAISSLENNVQTDNSHPLSRADYRPIDDFSEALGEVDWIKTSPVYAQQASAAQANINAEDILSLFADAQWS
jgi:uncharacterized membrane-anchored protein YjiN (DUF445 family)